MADGVKGWPARLAAATVLAGLLLVAPACAQQSAPTTAPPPPEKRDDAVEGTAKKAGQIATQPVRDVGISKREIPPVLVEAVEAPYATAGVRTCRQITGAMAELNEVLGPDFVAGETKKENKAGKLAEAGGKTVINAFIPFRGLVREIRGAAPAERRYNAALDAGLARRGFLRGMAKAKGCKIP
jgi:hypothetical protein